MEYKQSKTRHIQQTQDLVAFSKNKTQQTKEIIAFVNVTVYPTTTICDKIISIYRQTVKIQEKDLTSATNLTMHLIMEAI